jgi:hypothetical protein
MKCEAVTSATRCDRGLARADASWRRTAGSGISSPAMSTSRSSFAAVAAPLLVTLLTSLAVPEVASAADVKRRGGQVEGTVGASLCIPGRGECKSADTVSGKTGPSLGMGFLIGFRPIRSLLIGGAYNLGFFNPDYRVGGADLYKSAYQNSVFAVVRAILPIWRLDLGLEVGPGYSRQTFKAKDTGGLNPISRTYSQGFALKAAPVVDFFITRRFFLGAKIDFIFNFHKQSCVEDTGGSRVCGESSDYKQSSVHQMLVGFHLGGTF